MSGWVVFHPPPPIMGVRRLRLQGVHLYDDIRHRFKDDHLYHTNGEDDRLVGKSSIVLMWVRQVGAGSTCHLYPSVPVPDRGSQFFFGGGDDKVR